MPAFQKNVDKEGLTVLLYACAYKRNQNHKWILVWIFQKYACAYKNNSNQKETNKKGESNTEEKSIQDALINRRSIRDFSSKQVSEETMRDIVKDARWAPSWANGQPWKLYVALGKAAEEIRRDYRNGTARQEGPETQSYQGERWGRREQLNMSHWGGQLQQFLGSEGRKFGQSQQNLFNAPAIAVITISAQGPLWEVFDAGAFEESLMLSAYNHGVDSIAAVAFVTAPSYLRQKLGIPDSERILMGLGYRSDAAINRFRSDREKVEDILSITNELEKMDSRKSERR